MPTAASTLSVVRHRRTRRARWSHTAAGLAIAAAVATTGAGLAQASPATSTPLTPGPSTAAPATTGSMTATPTTGAPTTATPTTGAPTGTLADTMELGALPLDSRLAEAVRALKASGADQTLLKAAETVKNSLGQISPDQITALMGQLPLSSQSASSPATVGATDVATTLDPLAALRAAGIQTFTPSVAPFCAAPTADNPLGLVTAGAGAVAGPWPLKTEPTTPINSILQMIPGMTPLQPFNLVKEGETAYAFVPASATTGGKIQVAWFNTTTLQGGFQDLQPLGGADNKLLTTLFPALGAIRLAPVKTGQGTILSAVYGTAQHGSTTCYFLPAVGVVNA